MESTETQGGTARQRLRHRPAGTRGVLGLTAVTRVWVVNTAFVTDRRTFFSADPSLLRPEGRLVPVRSSVTIPGYVPARGRSDTAGPVLLTSRFMRRSLRSVPHRVFLQGMVSVQLVMVQ
jgi:hypothetical protein